MFYPLWRRPSQVKTHAPGVPRGESDISPAACRIARLRLPAGRGLSALRAPMEDRTTPGASPTHVSCSGSSALPALTVTVDQTCVPATPCRHHHTDVYVALDTAQSRADEFRSTGLCLDRVRQPAPAQSSVWRRAFHELSERACTRGPDAGLRRLPTLTFRQRVPDGSE